MTVGSREDTLTYLCEAVRCRLLELEELRERAQRFAARSVAIERVLCDGFTPTEVVYALVDPAEPEAVRYVGQTNNPVGRYRAHLSVGPVGLWAQRLREHGRAPVMLLLERCTPSTVGEREWYWIHHYRERGCADLNRQIGAANA